MDRRPLYGIWRVFVMGVALAALVLWLTYRWPLFLEHVRPGYSVVVMTLLASLITIWPPKPESREVRALLVLAFGFLSVLELVAINHEHGEQVKQYDSIVQHFQSIESNLEALNSVNREIETAQKQGTKPESVKLRALQLSKEILTFVSLRSINRPILTVPAGADYALYQFKLQMYQQFQEQFNRDVRSYWSDHFSDRVTRLTIELDRQGKFPLDDCKNPLFLELYSTCANQIKDAAGNLP